MILLVGKDKESTDQEVKNEQANDKQTALNQASKRKLQDNQKSDFVKQNPLQYQEKDLLRKDFFWRGETTKQSLLLDLSESIWAEFVSTKYSSLYFASEVPFALPRAL